MLAPLASPFQPTGGLKVMRGNLGRAICKTSALRDDHRIVEAPARIFESQEAVVEAFRAGEFTEDVVVVVRYQGPRANGMPELHKLTPPLGVLLGRGLQVALVTDGRMSGASGKVPAAIQVTPECCAGGSLAKVRDGDIVRVDTHTGELTVMLSDEELAARPLAPFAGAHEHVGMGRELFSMMRGSAGPAEEGGSCFLFGGISAATPTNTEVTA